MQMKLYVNEKISLEKENEMLKMENYQLLNS